VIPLSIVLPPLPLALVAGACIVVGLAFVFIARYYKSDEGNGE
jgi:hypothetical protein